MTPAQRDLLGLVEAMKKASSVTEKAELTPAQDVYLSTLGTALSHQIAAATYTTTAMEQYAKLSQDGERT